MTKLKIKVTKDILERSKMCGFTKETEWSAAENCAIALAVRDVFPKASVCIPGIIRTYGYKETRDIEVIMLPNEAEDFIYLFDNTLIHDRPNLPELEFEVNIPESVIEKINIDELKPLLENHPNLKLLTV